jgi:hypothetical protein
MILVAVDDFLFRSIRTTGKQAGVELTFPARRTKDRAGAR